MKKWFTKWQISGALDDGKPLPPAVKHAISNSEELRRFAEDAAALDEALKNTRPAPAAPAGLHAAILRAVAQTSKSAVSPISNRQAVRTRLELTDNRRVGNLRYFAWEKFWPRLLPISALGLLMILGLLGAGRFFRPPPVASSSSLALASTTLETGDELVRTAPATALSPLSDEMRRLDRDVTNAQNYLLASLP